ncbi:Hypothetical protein SCF082_LOCUS21095 [Durusdinium trenchii]|uniref:Uncharacterized protein n=1 Tax=Durusdinium trenchii TaxID=1381693 RepID=A0ABP0L9U8_9DINO
MVKRRKGLSPDDPDFIPLEDRPRVSVVRCSLMGRIRVNDDTARKMVAQVLEAAADRASKLVYRASTFLHYWVAERLAANEDVVLNRDTLKQVYALFNAESAARRHRPSESMVQAFVATRAQHVDCTGLTNINDAARTELLTSLKNYDEIALEAHIAMYLTAKYDVKRGHGSALATKVFRKSPGLFVTLPATLEGGVDRWNTVVREEHARFKEAKGAPGGILRYRLYMMQIIEERNRGRDPDKQYRAFSLLPQRKVGRGFISIDKKTCKELGALAKQLFPNADRSWRSGVFNEEVDALFNREGLKKQGKFRLGPTVKTNGVELHVLFETTNYPRHTEGRRCGQGKRLKAAEQTCPAELDPPIDFCGITLTDWTRMVTIDPGNTNPVTLARPIDPEDAETRFSTASLSKGWYTKHSKRRKMKRRGDRDTPKQINKELSEHSLKTSSVESLLTAVRLRFKHHDETHAAASKKQRLKLRFEVKQAEERAINNTINWILRGGKHTGAREVDVVVFGDAGRMSGLKGTSVSAPMAKIKRLATRRGRVEGFQVYEVNEAYTSKRSSCCPGADAKNMVTGHKMDETADGRRVRSKVHGLCRARIMGGLHFMDQGSAAFRDNFECVRNIAEEEEEKRRLEELIRVVDAMAAQEPPEPVPLDGDAERAAFEAGWNAYKRFVEGSGGQRLLRENLRITGTGDVVHEERPEVSSRVRGMHDLPKETAWEAMGFAPPEPLMPSAPELKTGRRLKDGAHVRFVHGTREYLNAVPGDIWFLLLTFAVVFLSLLLLRALRRKKRRKIRQNEAPPAFVF